MDIKLISLDLDGTLLDSSKRLPPENESAIKECIERGIHIVPTTGRTVDGIPPAIRSIPGIRYAITTNGAVIADMEEQEVLDSCRIPQEQALDILNMIDEYHVMYDPYIDGRGATEPRFFNHMEEYGLPPEIQELVRMTRDVHPNIREYVSKRKRPVEKINLFFGDMEERARLRRKLEERGDLVISSSMPMNLELNAPGATKGRAILRLAGHLGLKREQTMAIGDGENDFSMIVEAGIGVAMGNSHPRLLKLADYVTETNDEAGVAAAIRRFVLGTE